MKKIKEIRLGVGSGQPHYPGTQTVVHNGYNGGVLNNADSSFSRHMQKTYTDQDFSDDESSEEDEDMILEKRVFRGGKYCLVETLEKISEKAKPDFLDLDKDGDKKETMKKAAKEKKEKNNESLDEKRSCSECGASIYEGQKHTCEHNHSEKESFEEINLEKDVDEQVTMSGGSIQGYTGKFGDEKGKNIPSADYLQKEQIDWMRRMELYHKKTTGRLK
jgi:hypothetical protein